MKVIKNIFLCGNFSFLLIIIIVNIFSGVTGNIDQTQQPSINENGEIGSSQITQISQTPHTPIVIDGNDEFASQAFSEGWSGNGSISDPYCISNYSISSPGEPGVFINNTDVNFIIVNVTVTGATNLEIGAFHFSNVTYGELKNNTATNSYYGFRLDSSSNYNVLTENTAIYNNYEGFRLDFSSNNSLTGNIATNNIESGFYLESSSNYNVLTGNTAKNNNYDGFRLDSSSNNLITGNTATNNNYDGFRLDSSSNNVLTGNTATNNIDLGFDLSYSSNYNVLTGNTATNNSWFGFIIDFSSNNVFNDNIATDSTYHGFYLHSSSNNSLIGNIASNNSYYGFRLDTSSNYNTFNYNNITYNNLYGLYAEDVSNNSIFLNTFIGNNNGNTQAYSESQNYWNNGTHGNYWSDYTGVDSNGDGIGDTAYPIDGTASESDHYPLISPVEYVVPEFSANLLFLSMFLGLFSLGILFKKNTFENN